MRLRTSFCVLLTAVALSAAKKDTPTPLDEYIAAAKAAADVSAASPGSLYTPGGRLGDPFRDLRASQIGDLVTILVSDRASAVSSGATSSSRAASASASIPSLFGTHVTPFLKDMAKLGSETSLDGQGSTSRSNVLTATLSARVVDVLPNGYLVVEGIKDVQANSEKQRITVRGVVRWNDVSATNTVRSDRVGQMEIRVDGKGVVADATRRPNILYRILLGVLPF